MSDWVNNVDPFDRTCPSRGLLHSVGDKWAILVILSLDGQELRFNEIERLVDGISPKMLTQRLNTLVGDGLLKRTPYEENPPRVVYELTTLGMSLLPVAYQLVGWVIDNMAEVAERRQSL